MFSIFAAELAASRSVSSGPECEPLHSASVTNFAGLSLADTGQASHANQTSQRLALSVAWQTWLRRVSPAKTFHSQERVPDCPASVPVSGGKYAEPFAWYDRASRSWRTWQLCLDGEWERYSEDWPRSGMTRNGIAYRLPPLVFHTPETGFGLLPTPTVKGNYNRAGASKTSGDGYYTRFKKLFGRYPTVTETEMIMGYPQQWTRSATPSCPASLQKLEMP